MERWIFVLLCLSFVGELVFGSIFPPVSPGTSSPTVPSQQEVTWSPEGLVNIQGMVVGEEKIYTRVVHAEDGRNSAAATPEEVVVVVGAEQKPTDEPATVLPKDDVVRAEQKTAAADQTVTVVTTRNNSETETTTSLRPPSG